MERALKPYDKEFMRLAMLKHEETFKEQVYELHRVYRIQKLLMRNIGKTNINSGPDYNHQVQNTHQQFRNPSSSRIGFSFIPNNDTASPPDEKLVTKLDPERPAADEFDVTNGDLIDECEIELTLGPTSYGKRNRKRKMMKKNPETPPLTSDSAGRSSFSSSSTGSSQVNMKESGTKNERSSSNSNVDNGEMRLEQNRLQQQLQQQPPWLFQVLSLNMT